MEDTTIDVATTVSRDDRSSISMGIAANNKTLLGLFERLPFCFRLVMITLVSLCGMIIFGSWLIGVEISLTSKSARTPQFLSVGATTRNLVQQLQLERSQATLYMVTQNTTVLGEMVQQRRLVDTSLQDYINQVSNYYTVLDKSQEVVGNVVHLMRRIRFSVDSQIIAPQDVAQVFNTMITDIVNVLTNLCFLGETYRECIVHNTLLRISEEVSMTRGLGNIVFFQKASSNGALIQQFLQTYFNQKSLLNVLAAYMTPRQTQLLDTKVTALNEFLQTEQAHGEVNLFVFHKGAFPIRVTEFQWFSWTTVVQNGIQGVISSVETEFSLSASNSIA